MDDVLKLQNQSQTNQSLLQGSSTDAAGSPDSLVVCLKCSKQIVHAAYKYNGCTFHAVCLKCNFCARNLSAKPFIIQDTKIFCSDHCKTNFEGAAAVTTESIPNQQDTEHLSGKKKAEDASEGESLIEVLENIQEGKIELLKISKKESPIGVLIQLEDDPDRLTDYPRIQSPEAESHSRRSSVSVSAVSESSLTSEGSSSVMSYDANKVPKKKILKNPQRQRKHSRNRVRWNLPVGDESDTSSVHSFESTSAASEIFGRARSSVAEVRHGWKGEFEFSPPHGSTGMTPEKHFYRRNNPNSHHPHHLIHLQQNQRQLPRMHHIHSDSSLLSYTAMNPPPTSTTQSLLGGSSGSPNHPTNRMPHSYSATDLPQVNGRSLAGSASLSPLMSVQGMPEEHRVYQRSTSPLAKSAFSSSGHKQLNHVHSTPLSHSQSESALAARLKAMNALKEPSGSEVVVPVLRLDMANIPELEESTLEDRQRRHVFQFPQNSPVSQDSSSVQHNFMGPVSSKSGSQKKMTKSYSLPTTTMLFVDDDDADDYDHLSPLKNEELTSNNTKQSKKSKKTDQQKVDEKQSKKQRKVDQQKADEDKVRQALPVSRMEKEADVNAHTEKDTEANLSSNAKQTRAISTPLLSTVDEVPPPVPKKLGARVQNETERDKKMEPRKNRPGSLENKLSSPEIGIVESMKVPEGEKKQLLSAKETRYKTEGKATNMESTSSNTCTNQPVSVSTSTTTGSEERATKTSYTNDHSHSRHSHSLPGKSTEKSSASTTRGDSKAHRRTKDKVPPPIPPKKTTRIRRQDRDSHGNPLIHTTTLSSLSSSQSSNETYPSQEVVAESVITDDHTDYFVHEQDIVPPPPEFSDMDFFTSKGSKTQKSTNPPQDDGLSASTSNTTLIAEPESDSQKEVSSHTAASSTDSPLQSGRHKNRHRKFSHQEAVREKSDTPEDVLRASGSALRQQHQAGNVSAEDCNNHGREKAKSKYVVAATTSHKSDKDASTSGSSTTNHIPPSSVAKTAHMTEKSKPHSPHTDRNSSMKESKPGTADPLQPTRRIPSRPAPPPPSRSAPPPSAPPQGQKASDQVTEEEKLALQLAYPTNGKIPMMAPTVHDTDKHIQDMLTDINSEESRSKRTTTISFRMCVACSQAITNRKDFCSHEGMCYHIGCFHCCRCAVSLQGRAIFKIKNSLLCRDCYPKNNSTSRLAVNRAPQNKFHGAPGTEYYAPPGGEYYVPPPSGYHAPSTGGQITSV